MPILAPRAEGVRRGAGVRALLYEIGEGVGRGGGTEFVGEGDVRKRVHVVRRKLHASASN